MLSLEMSTGADVSQLVVSERGLFAFYVRAAEKGLVGLSTFERG